MHAVVQRLAANLAGASATVNAPPVESPETPNAVNTWVARIDSAFRKGELATAFAYARGGVHRHGAASDKLCKRYLFMLDVIVRAKVNPKKKPEGPPKMLYLRELFAVLFF